MINKYDVVIIGGGPSGSSLGILLAKKGKKVLILEKDYFPKHSIGESLLPDTTYRFLKILGVKDKVDNAGFARKYGGSYIWGKSKKPWHLIFDGNLDNKILGKNKISSYECSQILNGKYKYSYQVNRYIFDKILSDKAKEVGTIFLENTKVENLLFDDNKNIIGVKTKKGNFFGKIIVDAGGRGGFIRNKLKISERNKDLGFFSLYTYFKNCSFYDNFYSKYTQLIVSIDIGWIWFIHIGGGMVSIGIVSNDKNLNKELFFKKIRETEYIKDSIKGAIQCDYLGKESKKIYSISNWSNISKKLFGKNFVLIGDAGGFVDPILSGGMSFAINTAFLSYVHIIEFLEKGNINIFKNYEKLVYKDIEDYLGLAKFWYGNNRVVDSYFWLAKKQLGLDLSNRFNRLAFIYLSSGNYYSDRNLRLFNGEIKIGENVFDKHERIRIENLLKKIVI